MVQVDGYSHDVSCFFCWNEGLPAIASQYALVQEILYDAWNQEFTIFYDLGFFRILGERFPACISWSVTNILVSKSLS
jgi:hypothetical protein